MSCKPELSADEKRVLAKRQHAYLIAEVVLLEISQPWQRQ